MGLLAAVSVLFWLGCGSPRERYKVLSFFFDGVPDPDAPKLVIKSVATTGPTIKPAVIVSQHKPYVDNQCDACHRSTGGTIIDFDAAYSACVTCHKTVTTKYPRMHGPVATAACRWCHTPHESTEPALLKQPPLKVCTQCHDQQLLGTTPPQHSDGKTSCIACHFGHGGAEANFLKPRWKTEWIKSSNPAAETQPASAPATGPATAPATAPATMPAPSTVPAPATSEPSPAPPATGGRL